MLITRAAWGLDLSGGALKAARIEARGGLIYRVTHAFDLPYAALGEGSQTPRAGLPEGLARPLAAFVEEHRSLLSDPVFVGIPTYSAVQGQLLVPSMDSGRERELLEFELHRTLNRDPEEMVLRIERASRLRRGEQPLSYYCQPEAVVSTFVAELRQLGLSIDGLVPEPFALARYLALEWPARGRCFALHVQRTRTDLLYLTEHGPRFRSLPIGVAGLTGYSAGSRLPPRAELESLARLLVAEHHRAVERFFGHADHSAIDRVILLGDATQLPAMQECLADMLQTEVAVLNAPRRLSFRRGVLSISVPELSQVAGALGLSLCGLSGRGEEFSLVKPPAGRRSQRRIPALTLSLLLLTLALVFVRHQSTSYATELQQLEAGVSGNRWESLDEKRAIEAEGQHLHRLALDLQGRRDRLASHRDFAAKLLETMDQEDVHVRLVRWELSAQKDLDRVVLEFEKARGLPQTREEVARWVRERLHFQIDSSEAYTDPSGEILRVVVEAHRAPAGRKRP